MNQQDEMNDVADGAPQPEVRRRPSIEEFVRAGYKAEDYDQYFSGEHWGPGWSEKDAASGLLYVYSGVRRLSTRLQRTRHPTRHRFKQYLFGDPSLRLVRRRPLKITQARALAGVNELIERERVGLLYVCTPDGRHVDLEALRGGTLVLAQEKPAAPLPNPPLDSIANDTPAGIPLPQHPDGSFPGDPAAQRALDRMQEEKRAEGERSGALEDPAAERQKDAEAAAVAAETPAGAAAVAAPDSLAGESVTEPQSANTLAVAVSDAAEPAAPAAAQTEVAATEPAPSAPEPDATPAVEPEAESSVDPAAERAKPKRERGSKKK